MRSSVFLFATDLIDEGFPNVLGTLREPAGVDAVTMAGNYHHSRDLFPHNPVRKVRFFHGEVYFRPDPVRYEGQRIQPPVSNVVEHLDPLAELIEHADREGLEVRVWTNNTHNSRLGQRYPDCAVHNCFGDPLVFALCPANPAVRAYLCSLSADIARYPIQSLVAEAMGFLPFDHGWHHERAHVSLSPAVKFLLGLCFCEHCQAAARSEGVRPEPLQDFLRRELNLVLGAEASALDDIRLELSELGALDEGELGGYLRAREKTVTSLCTEVVSAVREIAEVPVTFMDMSGGVRGVGSGMTVDVAPEPAPARAWQDGVNLSEIGRVCDGVSMLGYSREIETVSTDLDAYLEVVPAGRLSVGLRPMMPDCESEEDLIRKVGLLRQAGVAWADFYHYGFMPIENVGWIGRALEANGPA